MQRKSILILIISLLVLLLGLNEIARAQETAPAGTDATPVTLGSYGTLGAVGTLGSIGTAFTYQGQLKDADGPVTASCDFHFGLWDALTSGTQVGTTLEQTNVTVSEGLFTVQLDFGSSVFAGSARWLEIAVRCPTGNGSYTKLVPRQPLTAAPYANYAITAGVANTAVFAITAGSADTLDGQHASEFQQHYQNLVVVAKSGGDFSTITDALNSITTNSASNPFTIYVAPGVYTETVSMKSYVDIEGAGEKVTKITCTNTGSLVTGTVNGVDNAELRFLTVESTGGSNLARAIYNSCGQSLRITHVTAIASGGMGYTIGVSIDCGSSPILTNVTAIASGGSDNNSGVRSTGTATMVNVTAIASGGTNNYGVWNDYYSSTMTNVTAKASGGTNNYGVYNDASSPAMTSVTATASGGTNSYGVYNDASSPAMTNVIATASDGTNNYGVYSTNSSSPTMTDVTATASGGTNGYGVWNSSSSLTIQNSILSGSGSYTGDGIHNTASSGTYTVKVNNSQIIGGSSTIYSDSTSYTTQIGASQLIGGGVQGSGNYKCVASYNGNFAALNDTCH